MSVSSAPHLRVFEQSPPPQTRITPGVYGDRVVHHVLHSEWPHRRLVDVVARSDDLLLTGAVALSACCVDDDSAGLHADLLLVPSTRMRNAHYGLELELRDGTARHRTDGQDQMSCVVWKLEVQSHGSLPTSAMCAKVLHKKLLEVKELKTI